jgi:hypothetical protein
VVFNAPVKMAMRFFLMSIAVLAPAQILRARAQLDVGGPVPGALQPNPPTGCAASTRHRLVAMNDECHPLPRDSRDGQVCVERRHNLFERFQKGKAWKRVSLLTPCHRL